MRNSPNFSILHPQTSKIIKIPLARGYISARSRNERPDRPPRRPEPWLSPRSAAASRHWRVRTARESPAAARLQSPAAATRLWSRVRSPRSTRRPRPHSTPRTTLLRESPRRKQVSLQYQHSISQLRIDDRRCTVATARATRIATVVSLILRSNTDDASLAEEHVDDESENDVQQQESNQPSRRPP